LTPTDRAIVRQLYTKEGGVVTAMENISELDLADLVAEFPKLHIILRPYYQPDRSQKQASFDAYFNYAVDWLGKFIQKLPQSYQEGRLWSQLYNEPNMPWNVGWWEGFGERLEDMQLFQRVWLEQHRKLKQKFPKLNNLWPALTIGNNDVRYPSDPPGLHYYMEECQESIAAADGVAMHIRCRSLDEATDWAWGLRILRYMNWIPQGKPIWVTEAGAIHKDQVLRGKATVRWLNAVASIPDLKGACLYISGWDREWMDERLENEDGSIRPIVRDAATWLAQQPAPIRLCVPLWESSAVEKRFGEDPGVYAEFGLPGHDGIDYACPVGSRVLAAADGEVIFADEVPFYGLQAVLEHGWGRTYYAGLRFIEVKKGERVKAGAPLGLSGETGRIPGPHLHFGLRIHAVKAETFRNFIDPFPYVVDRPPGPPPPGPVLKEGVIEGRVVNGAGRTIVLMRQDEEIARQAIGSDERYRFPELEAGTYVVVVEGTPVRVEVSSNGLDVVSADLELAQEAKAAYKSHYVLLSQNAPKSWLTALQNYALAFRCTMGFSHNDAAVVHGSLGHTITLIGAEDSPYGIPAEIESAVRALAPQARIDRVNVHTATELAAVMDDRAATGRRYGDLSD